MSPIDNLALNPGLGSVRDLKNLEKNAPLKDVPGQDSSKAFSDLLVDKMGEELRFSQHAMKRMETRGIDLSSSDILKMQDAVKKAHEKGAKESLILSDKGAFVVSVKNNTVITAIDKGSLKENVFTNIDSTIMI
jgi:flagellar operon protein